MVRNYNINSSENNPLNRLAHKKTDFKYLAEQYLVETMAWLSSMISSRLPTDIGDPRSSSTCQSMGTFISYYRHNSTTPTLCIPSGTVPIHRYILRDYRSKLLNKVSSIHTKCKFLSVLLSTFCLVVTFIIFV